MPDRSNTWDGGYKRKNSKGKTTFIIYKRIKSKLYEISTRATSSAAAEAHWKRFQADPEGYKPQGEAPKGALLLDQELGAAFLVWSRDAKHNTPKWVRDQQRALAWWQERLEGLDLRTVKTSRLMTALDTVETDPKTGKKRGEKQLKATLKTFYGWLRTERHSIATAEDPTYGQLKVPQSDPAQWKKVKAITASEYHAARAALGAGEWRDALDVLAATGWHATELERFAASGGVEKHPHTGDPVLVCPQTKGGGLLRTQVNATIEEAAKRIRARGALDYFRFREALIAAGAKFNPGVMRHSTATWAINAGAEPAAVAAFLGHKSLATTRRFYATHAVPAKIPTLTDLGADPVGQP